MRLRMLRLTLPYASQAMETIMSLVSEREIKSHAAAAALLARTSRHAAETFEQDRPLPPPPSLSTLRGSEREAAEATRERNTMSEYEQVRVVRSWTMCLLWSGRTLLQTRPT